jgi:hypothetical protein
MQNACSVKVLIFSIPSDKSCERLRMRSNIDVGLTPLRGSLFVRTDAKLIFCHAALPARAIKWKLSRHLRGIKVSFSTPRRRISSRRSLAGDF